MYRKITEGKKSDKFALWLKKVLCLPKKIALQNVVSKDSGRKHDKCLTYCQSHISEIFAVSPLFHKGVPSFLAISFGVYTKWFSVTCDAYSFGFVFKVSAKVLDRNFFRTGKSLFCPSPQKLHNTACSDSWHLYLQQAWLVVGQVDHEDTFLPPNGAR